MYLSHINAGLLMPGNKRKNKARNQIHGSIDAPWFKRNRIRQRNRTKMAKASKRANRGK